jgi:hypothetical protein
MTKRAEFWIEGRPLLPEPYPYPGLDNIFLLNGVTITEDWIEFEGMSGLHHAIAHYIAEKPEPTAAELRFLRTEKAIQSHLAHAGKTAELRWAKAP